MRDRVMNEEAAWRSESWYALKPDHFEYLRKNGGECFDGLPLADVSKAMKYMAEIHVATGDYLNCPTFLHFPPGGNPSTRQILRTLKKLREDGYRRLLFGGPDPLIRRDFPMILHGARKLGFEFIILATHGGNLPDDPSLLDRIVRETDHIFLRSYSGDRELFARLTGKPERFDDCNAAFDRLVGLGAKVSPWFIVDDEDPLWIPREMERLSGKGAGSFLLSYPVHGIERNGKRVFPDLDKLRSSLVDAKYKWKKTAYQVLLYGYPPCALGFGEEYGLDSLQPPPVIQAAAISREAAGIKPLSLHESFPSQGLLACHCLWQNRCPSLPKEYLENGKNEKPQPLGIDYAQFSEGQRPNVIVRLTLKCNQNCSFCFVRREGPTPSTDELKQRLMEIRPHTLTLSGGEPSLTKDLPELIRWAKERSIKQVVLQTNAILFAKKERAVEILRAGLSMAFVSLHSHRRETSEKLTKAPGTFVKTIQGIENLSALPLGVSINHVIQKANYRELPDFVRWASEHFHLQENKKIGFTFSFIALMGRDILPVFEDFVPMLSEVKPYLIDALEFCVRSKIKFQGLETQCSVPRCILDGNPDYYPPPARCRADDFIKGPDCHRCIHHDNCFGLRPLYAERYGTDELKPILG